MTYLTRARYLLWILGLGVFLIFIHQGDLNAQTTFTFSSNATYSGGSVINFLNNNSTVVGSGADYTIEIEPGVRLTIDAVNMDFTVLPGNVTINVQGNTPNGGGQIFFKENDGSLTLKTGDYLSINPENENGFTTTQGNQIKIFTDGEDYKRNDLSMVIEAGGVNGDGTLGAPLPVELVEFKIRREGNTVVLSWITASEISNEKFIVEHSTDGRVFKKMGSLDGAGNSLETIKYEYTVQQPLTRLNYFRLKQVDFDGTVSFSKTISIELPNEAGTDIEIWLCGNQLHLVGSQEFKPGNIQLYNLNGQLLLFSNIEEGLTQVDLSILQPGFYVYKLNVGRKTISKLLYKP